MIRRFLASPEYADARAVVVLTLGGIALFTFGYLVAAAVYASR
jgi:hypothetical protein